MDGQWWTKDYLTRPYNRCCKCITKKRYSMYLILVKWSSPLSPFSLYENVCLFIMSVIFRFLTIIFQAHDSNRVFCIKDYFTYTGVQNYEGQRSITFRYWLWLLCWVLAMPKDLLIFILQRELPFSLFTSGKQTKCGKYFNPGLTEMSSARNHITHGMLLLIANRGFLICEIIIRWTVMHIGQWI